MRLPLVALALALLPAAAQAELQGVLVSGRVSHDVGGAYVPGTESGVGGGVGLSVLFGPRARPWEAGLEVNVAGYESSGDGDSILIGQAMIGRRFSIGDASRGTYLSLATGYGGVFIAGNDEVAIPLRVGLGLSLHRERAVGADVSLFNRLHVIHIGDFPGLHFINSTGFQVAIRFGR